MNTEVRTILEEKGHETFSVKPGEHVLSAVRAMCERRVGAILVCENDEVIGILSERDVMTRVILEGRAPDQTLVRDVMTRDVVAIDPKTSTMEAMAIMTKRRCRHLPVMDGGKVVGVLSIGDLVRHVSAAQEYEIRMLTDYVSGAVR